MSTREPIDEAILRATIKIAGNSRANCYNTKAIAQACGVSEFVIYDHFKSKEKLIRSCCEEIDDFGWAIVHRTIQEKGQDFNALFNALLDGLLANPDDARFLLNYSDLFPRNFKTSTYEDSYRSRLKDYDRATQIFASSIKPEFKRAMVIFLFREMICDAEMIMDHVVEDTPANRSAFAGFLFAGLDSVPKRDNTPK